MFDLEDFKKGNYLIDSVKKLIGEDVFDVELINNVVQDLEEKIKNLNYRHISGSGIN